MEAFGKSDVPLWKSITIEITYKHDPNLVVHISDPKKVLKIQRYIESIGSQWRKTPYTQGYVAQFFVEGFDSRGKRCCWLGLPKQKDYFISRQQPHLTRFFDNNEYQPLTDGDYKYLITLLGLSKKQLHD